MKRRNFIKTTMIAAAGTGLTGHAASCINSVKTENKLPRWRGFNLLDYFTPYGGSKRMMTTDEDLKWIADWGFDFVRLPMAYPRYVKFDSTRNITPDEILDYDEKVLDNIQELVERANKYGLHTSINLHRAPGFCINAGFHEPYNLWLDEEAQDAFYEHWSMWGKRFRNFSPEQISFDLLNEPCLRKDMNDQFSNDGAVPGELYRKVAVKAMDAIRNHNPEHLIIADGNNVGNEVIPEFFDLDIGQSCRGYFPHYVSHYRASWVWKNPDDAPVPVWPGEINEQYFSRKNLEEVYAPWIDALNRGVGVHCGECGCYRETPHEVFLAWFGDVLDILTEHKIGYALWNFRGDFGIMDSGRKDVDYEEWHGHKLDRKLLNLLQKY